MTQPVDEDQVKAFGICLARAVSGGLLLWFIALVVTSSVAYSETDIPFYASMAAAAVGFIGGWFVGQEEVQIKRGNAPKR